MVTGKWKFSNAAPIYLAQLCAALMPLIVAPVVIRTLGLDVFGVYASLMMASQLGLIISEYSFDAVGPRLLADRQSPADQTYQVVLATKLPTMLVGVGSGAAAFSLITGNLPSVFDTIGIALVVAGTAMLAPWFLISTQKTILYSSLVGGARIVSAVTIVFSILLLEGDALDGSVIFLMYAVPVGVVGCMAFYLALKNGFATTFGSDNLRLLKHGLPAFLGTSAISIQNIFGQFIIGLVAGPISLGIYNAVDRPARILSAALKPVFQTLYPHVVSLHKEDPEKAWHFNLANLRIAAGLSLPVLLVCALFSEQAIALIYGEDLAAYHTLLPIIVTWIILGILNNFVGIQGLQAAGRDKIYSLGMWLSLAIAVVGSLLSIEATPYVYYVAASVAAGELAAFLVYSAIMWSSHARRE